MILTSEIKEKIRSGNYTETLKRLYVCEDVRHYEKRMLDLVEGFETHFGQAAACIVSAPGRTELGGNHTDHQHGCVLAASVDLDILACAAYNSSNLVRIRSKGYPVLEIDLGDLTPHEDEINTSAALIRGIASKISSMGYPLQGFDAYAVSDVLGGSGLSSSAAYENLIASIFNHLCCRDEIDAAWIAKIGQYAENAFFGKPCGLMDQMASAVGSIVAIDFKDPQAPVVERIDFPFDTCGHVLCIIDSGADHADLTDEYGAVPEEMKAVAACFGKEVLRDVAEEEFFSAIPQVRQAAGDRAVLRAAHFYSENKRAVLEAQALKNNDFETFCHLAKLSGISSFTYLQNVYPSSMPQQQAVSIALMLAERLLDGRGAYRVHGGGFAGTIQAFVPEDMANEFARQMDAYLGEGACHILRIRPEGCTVLAG